MDEYNHRILRLLGITVPRDWTSVTIKLRRAEHPTIEINGGLQTADLFRIGLPEITDLLGEKEQSDEID